MSLSGPWVSPSSSRSSAKRWLGKTGDAKSQQAGEKRPVARTLPAAGVSTQLRRLVNSGALINRYTDVKLGLVSSARKGNSRDY